MQSQNHYKTICIMHFLTLKKCAIPTINKANGGRWMDGYWWNTYWKMCFPIYELLGPLRGSEGYLCERMNRPLSTSNRNQARRQRASLNECICNAWKTITDHWKTKPCTVHQSPHQYPCTSSMCKVECLFEHHHHLQFKWINNIILFQWWFMLVPK